MTARLPPWLFGPCIAIFLAALAVAFWRAGTATPVKLMHPMLFMAPALKNPR